ncbi:MAG: HAMP domain-containing sensor histidine kinase, partial [Sphingobium sp.]
LYSQRRQLAAQRDELAALSASLKQADIQKNRFLAVLGHELRNPIAALNAGLIMLERKKGQPVEGDIRISMNRCLMHMTRLVEDLLDIARIEQGKISLQCERVDLNDVLAFAVETSRPAIDEAGHTLQIDLPPGPVLLNADHARLAQIIGNLISNAAKYTPAAGEIRLTARVEDQTAWIEVADNGIGIAPDQQSRIFGIFEQADVKGKVKQDGLGIGLALVKQLVELHGGTIRLKHSMFGEGSTFEVRLPTVE